MPNPYDTVPYLGAAFPQTHPRRLAVIATLFGMRPAPPANCRVLEIGAGDGGNLIAMAQAAPESSFLGIDLAAVPVAKANARIADLGLNNIQMQVLNLLDLRQQDQPFDYIVAHGVYSWIPNAARDGLLAAISRLLAPQGVAFVSYNALPGGHLRLMLREMMQFHLRGVEDPQERVEQARALLDFLPDSHSNPSEYHAFLRAEADAWQHRSDFALFHDELGEEYHPLYFHQFIDHASEHQLQFLGEAEFGDMQDMVLRPEAAATLRDLTDDIIVREQYLDFLKGRRFRQTLLCHEDLELDHGAAAKHVPAMLVSTSAQPGNAEGEYLGPAGARMKTAHPLALRIMEALIHAAPDSIPVTKLCKKKELQEAVTILLSAYGSRMIEFDAPAA